MEKPVVVFAAGVFDILHYGHTQYLQNARSLGSVLVVGLLTGEATRRYKPDFPIMSYVERFKVLKAIKYVDHIVIQHDTDPTETLKALWENEPEIFPDILVRASDVKEPVPGQTFIESKGGRVVIVPYTDTVSTTEIKRRIARAQ